MIHGARTFVVGLPRIDKKRNETMELLGRQGIVAEKFNAIDNDITGYATCHTYERDNPGTNWNMGPKLVNLFLAHVLLWRVCQYLPNDVFVIMEDDVRFSDDWKTHWDDDIRYLPSTFDILYIGSCCVEHHPARRVVHGRLNKVDYALCTHAYMIHKRAIPKLLTACEKIVSPVDIAMILDVTVPMERYAFFPRFCDQLDMILPP